MTSYLLYKFSTIILITGIWALLGTFKHVRHRNMFLYPRFLLNIHRGTIAIKSRKVLYCVGKEVNAITL